MTAAHRREDEQDQELPCGACNVVERLTTLETIIKESQSVHSDIRESQRSMRLSQQRMERALLGEEEIGHKGLVHRVVEIENTHSELRGADLISRVATMEKKTEKLNHKFILASGITAGLGMAWQYLFGPSK